MPRSTRSKNSHRRTPKRRGSFLQKGGEKLSPLKLDETFWQAQESLGCGRHALNNLFGGKYFVKDNGENIEDATFSKQTQYTSPKKHKKGRIPQTDNCFNRNMTKSSLVIIYIQ